MLSSFVLKKQPLNHLAAAAAPTQLFQYFSWWLKWTMLSRDKQETIYKLTLWNLGKKNFLQNMVVWPIEAWTEKIHPKFRVKPSQRPFYSNPCSWDKLSDVGSRRQGQIFGYTLLPTVLTQESPGKKDLGGGREEGKPRTSLICLMFTSNPAHLWITILRVFLFF